MNQTCYISKYYPHKFPDITSPHLNQTFSKHPKKKKKRGHTWECWAPTLVAAPLGPLKTIGTDICPADM